MTTKKRKEFGDKDWIPRDPKRIPRILKKIQTLWEKYPDQRLGQLLSNYVWNDYHLPNGTIAIFAVEDAQQKGWNGYGHDTTEDNLDKTLKRLKERKK